MVRSSLPAKPSTKIWVESPARTIVAEIVDLGDWERGNPMVLFVGGSNDVIAANAEVGLDTVVTLLRIAFFVLPVLTGGLALRICTTLKKREQAREVGTASVPGGATTA